jgi:hypothetical protein
MTGIGAYATSGSRQREGVVSDPKATFDDAALTGFTPQPDLREHCTKRLSRVERRLAVIGLAPSH